MLVALLAIKAAPNFESPLDSPLVAVVARIYSPPGDNRLSRHEVYICDIHGKHLRKISHMKDDAGDVVWQNSSRLEWTSQDSKGTTKWWRFEFNTHKVTQIPTGTLLKEGGLQVRPDSSALPEPLKFEYQPQGNSYTLNLKVHEKTFTLPDRIMSDFFDREHNLQWFETWTHDSSSGNHYSVYSLDWSTGHRQWVIEDAEDFDFSPSRSIYVAVKPFDDGIGGNNYGKGHSVYTARAWAGDWKTGKTWMILDGLVWAKSISLRPLK